MVAIGEIVEDWELRIVTEQVHGTVNKEHMSTSRMRGLNRTIGAAVTSNSVLDPSLFANSMDDGRDVERLVTPVPPESHAEAATAVAPAVSPVIQRRVTQVRLLPRP